MRSIVRFALLASLLVFAAGGSACPECRTAVAARLYAPGFWERLSLLLLPLAVIGAIGVAVSVEGP